MTSKRKQFKAHRRDLYFDVDCTCQHETINLGFFTPHTITISGYADDHFMDDVNKEHRNGTCKCGRKYRFQWFWDGVEFEFLDEVEKYLEKNTNGKENESS